MHVDSSGSKNPASFSVVVEAAAAAGYAGGAYSCGDGSSSTLPAHLQVHYQLVMLFCVEHGRM
jgi:hypothetical protein